MIKRFENFEFNEDWEEEDPELRYGPFNDILQYGKDGPEFKCRDRVKYIDDGDLYHKIGTVVDYHYYNDKYYYEGNYLICFDDNIKSWGDDIYKIPKEHGWFVVYNQIKKIKYD